MTANSVSAIPLWAEPYLPDFKVLRQILERSPHFLLQPVETPSPDVARALADWLRAEGWDLQVIELADTETWSSLLDTLHPPTSTPGAIMIIAPADLDPDVMRPALAQVNMQRDSLARAMDCPLLWCGSVELMQLTWAIAPDFWSIAATPYRIPLRGLDEALRALPSANSWWTGAAGEDLTVLEAAFASVREHDAAAAMELGLRLAECQLAHGDIAMAARTLDELAGMVAEVAASSARWQLLHQAVHQAKLAPQGVSLSDFQTAIAEAHARGDRHSEARIRILLATRLRNQPNQQAQGLAELGAARLLLLDEGDISAVLELDAKIITWSNHAPEAELVAAMKHLSERLLRDSDDLRIRQDATLVLACVYRWLQRWQDADDMAQRALALCDSWRGRPDYALYALRIRSTLVLERGDWSLAHALQTRMIELARSAQFLPSVAVAMLDRAQASIGRNQPLEACDDILAASTIFARIGRIDLAGLSLADAAQIAFSVGVPAMGVTLLMRSFLFLVRTLSLGKRIKWRFDTGGLRESDTELADRIDAFQDWMARRKASEDVQAELRAFDGEFRRVLDVREAELRARGVDPMDPATWTFSDSDG